MLLLCIVLYGESLFEQSDVEFTGIVHGEFEQMFGKENDDAVPTEQNSFGALFAHLLLNYAFEENFFISIGGKANGIFTEDNYQTPMYLRTKMTSDDINRAMVSEASLNYDNGFFALNVGRQSVDYDWLLGSIDGVLAMLGDDESLSLRLFWFENYRHLQYNYYMQIKDINAGKGMYGTITKANSRYLEWTLYDYYVQDLRNILGSNINIAYNNLGINLGYTSAKALSKALYNYDESFLNGSVEMLYQQHYMELGFSKTGKNGLLAMIQMGSFMFGQFYLSNQVDRENALNGFVKYIYADQQWRFEAIGGMTRYDNSFVRLESGMSAYEADVYLTYRFTPAFSMDVGAMYMNVDVRDPLQTDQALVMLNLVFTYENY